MTKKDLTDYLSYNFGFTKSVSNTVVSNIFDEIKNAIARGERVKLKGFGVFTRKTVKSRICRDPRNGERVDSPSKKKVLFKVSKELKKFINS